MRARVGTALTVLAAVALAVPVGAQPGRAGSPRVELRVEGLTGVLGSGGGLRLQVRVDNLGDKPVGDLRVVGTVHRKSTSRFDLQQAMDDGAVGTVRAALGVDVDALGPHGTRTVELVESTEELGFDRVVDRYGVYPLRIQLQHSGEVVDEVRTSVVLAPPEVREPLVVALLVPLDAPPARQADGSYDGGRISEALSADARLSRLVGALEGPRTMPLTVVTSGLLLEQVADLADGFTLADGPEGRSLPASGPPARQAARLLQQARNVVGRPEVAHLALPYGPADLVALVRAGMTSEATRQVSEGRVTSERLTDDRPESRMLWPPDGLDAATLAEAVGAGVDTVILSERQLDVPERELPFSPSPVRRLRSGTGASVDVLVPDPWIEQLLRSDVDQTPALVAQRVLAETAAVYFERPNTSAPRGLLLAPPQVWDPPPGTLEALVASLSQASWVRPVTAGGLVDAVRREPDPVALDYPADARARELDPDYVLALREARRGLGALTGVLPETDALPGRFDRLLLAAAAVHHRSAALDAEGRAMIHIVSDSVAQLYGSVDVPEGLPVTMTSVEGPVPVTLRSTAPVALRVQVRLESARFEFPDGAVQTADIEPGATETLTFRARALTPGGTSPLRVVVQDASGARPLTTGTVVIRSTAYSPVALGITGGAGVFLLAWWVRDARRRRRQEAAAGAARGRTAAA